MSFINDTDYFDQHFLVDKNIIDKFIKEANLNKDDIIVEIGPGKGNISSLIAPKVKKLICIELDKRLKPYLSELEKNNNNVEIIYGNVLEIYIPECSKIITSLPYSIIEPFINKLLKCKLKEILMITGNKYASNVEKNEINKLSLLTNCFFHYEKIIEISSDAFDPSPRVTSAMIRLIPKTRKDIKSFKLLMFRYMFYFKTKKIKNALVESLIRVFEEDGLVLTQKESKELISKVQISEELAQKNFETVSNEELKILSEKIGALEYDKNRFRTSTKKNI